MRYVKPGGDFVLLAHVWQPAAVMLGKASYPDLEVVLEQVRAAGARPVLIQPERLPLFEGQPVPDNVYTLGVAAAQTKLGQLVAPGAMADVIAKRWKRGAERNLFSFSVGCGGGDGMSASPVLTCEISSPRSGATSEVSRSLDAFFTPRAVALVGSVGEGKLGYELLRQMLAGGYRDVVAVNPKGQGALGVPGVTTIARSALPVDLAVIASPGNTVAAVLEECGQAGVKAAVVISSGFGEMGNKAGEEEIKAIASRYGIRIVGPNCAGIINTAHHLCPTLETLPPPGHVGIISQSGALAGVLLGWAKRDGLGISKFVSYGNRADVNEVDLLEYLADDPETHVVCVYIETVSDGRAFMAAAARCAAVKPIIVIKAGRGESGQRATLSHTGSLAGSDAVYDTAFRQCGAIRVTSAEEMFDLCRALTGLPRLTGRCVAVITNSGGPSILAADKAEAVGLNVAEPGPAVKAVLSTFLPAHAALKNPIDLTVEGTERGYRETLNALFATEDTEGSEDAREGNEVSASSVAPVRNLASHAPVSRTPSAASVTSVAKPFDAAVAINIAPPYLDSLPIARGIIGCSASHWQAGRDQLPS